jgi:hypothetical protein
VNKKIAVDPAPRFGLSEKMKQSFRSSSPLTTSYYKTTSDAFFAEKAADKFRRAALDICLVDGMHTYKYALRDVENALQYLSDDGVIIMHDCNPQTAEAGCSFEDWQARGYLGEWNGDVWKVILHLRSMRNDINTFVLDCDHGLGIITKGKQEKPLSFTPAQIEKLTYNEMAARREELLNLKPADYFYEYFRG